MGPEGFLPCDQNFLMENGPNYEFAGNQPMERLSALSMEQYQPMIHDFVYRADGLGRGRNDSSSSSTESSPNPRLYGARARAASLNTKSTTSRSTAHITQQQMNKKRQRATPDQLMVLEKEFMDNSSPTAKMRETISAQINMTERSVQIWFQNRRAKTKTTGPRRIGFDDLGAQQTPYGSRPGMPARSYSIDHENSDNLGSPYPQRMHGFPAGGVNSRLNCRSLTIGTWRRVACTSTDLVCYFTQNDPTFTYYINSGDVGFKIEYQIPFIAKIDLKYVQIDGSKEMGRATITLKQAPLFFMEHSPKGEWKQCTDFTEDKQATKEMDHAIVGPYEHLKSSFTELASCHKETIGLMSFEDLAMTDQYDPTRVPSQTYLDPGITENSSHCETQDLGPSPLPEMARTKIARGGHRRTRSRSAPIAIDFSHFGHQSYIDGLTGYSFRDQSSRVEPQHYNLQLQNIPMPNAYEYSDSLYTPTTVATPTYQDSWYNPSYATTPLLDSERSHLGSPLVPGVSQLDLSGTLPNEGYCGTYPLMSAALNNAIVHPGNPSQSMPDLTHLDPVPELPINNEQSQQHLPVEQLSMDMLGDPLGLSDMNFSHIPSTQSFMGPQHMG